MNNKQIINNKKFIIIIQLAYGLILWLSLTACFAPVQPNETALAPNTTVEIEATASETHASSNSTMTTQSATVGGYTFSPPVAIQLEGGPRSIIGWIPTNPDEVVQVHNGQLSAVNIYSGQLKHFSPIYERSLASSSVRLLKNGDIAFMPDLHEGATADLWIGGADDQQATAHVASNLALFPIMLPDEKTMLLTDADFKQSLFVNADGAMVKTKSFIPSLLETITTSIFSYVEDPLTLYSATSPNNNWVALYTIEDFYMVNFDTGEQENIIIKNHLSVFTLVWSPDGTKIAILATDYLSYPQVYFLDLYILEVDSWKLWQIETDFTFVTSLTWAPDNKQVLFTAKTEEVAQIKENHKYKDHEYKVSQLFLADIHTKQVELIPILPLNALTGFGRDLVWSTDGKKIALSATFAPPGKSYLYRIDVSKP